MWFGLAASGLHGVLLFFVHRITALVLAVHGRTIAAAGGALAAVTAAFGATVYAEIGSTLGDNTVGLLVLGALALLMANAQAGHAAILRAARGAGFGVGLAAGAKLVASLYVFGLFVAVLLVPGRWQVRLHRTLQFGLAAFVGIAVTGGYWMWLMHAHFGSPLFPYYNALFASPLAPFANFSDASRPDSWQAAVSFPFYFTAEQLVAGETYFRDARLPAALIALATIGLVAAKRRLSDPLITATVADVRLRQLAAFFLVSYVVWLVTFALYRYAIQLEALSAAIIVCGGVYLARSRSDGLLMTLPICALLIFSTKPLQYGRIPWATSFFGIERDQFTQYQDAVVLLPDFPTAYIVPFLPSSATVLRISSNWGLDPSNQMWKRLQERVAAAPSKRLYWLEIAPYATQAEADGLVAPFNVILQQSACEETKTNFDSLRICQVVRR
jgi:hypothetical protein